MGTNKRMHARMDGSLFPQYSGISSHSKGACIIRILENSIISKSFLFCIFMSSCCFECSLWCTSQIFLDDVQEINMDNNTHQHNNTTIHQNGYTPIRQHNQTTIKHYNNTPIHLHNNTRRWQHDKTTIGHYSNTTIHQHNNTQRHQHNKTTIYYYNNTTTCIILLAMSVLLKHIDIF